MVALAYDDPFGFREDVLRQLADVHGGPYSFLAVALLMGSEAVIP